MVWSVCSFRVTHRPPTRSTINISTSSAPYRVNYTLQTLCRYYFHIALLFQDLATFCCREAFLNSFISIFLYKKPVHIKEIIKNASNMHSIDISVRHLCRSAGKTCGKAQMAQPHKTVRFALLTSSSRHYRARDVMGLYFGSRLLSSYCGAFVFSTGWNLIWVFVSFSQSGSCESLASRDRLAGSEGELEGFEEGSVGGPRVPSIVSHCLEHLRRYGLRTLGLFRVGTSKKRVRQVSEKKSFWNY